MDYFGVRQNEAYQADMEEVAWQLVNDPGFTRRRNRQPGKIRLAHSPQRSAIETRNTLRISNRWIAGSQYRAGRFLKILQLASAMNLGMAGKDLFDQSTAGTRHAKHKNRD